MSKLPFLSFIGVILINGCAIDSEKVQSPGSLSHEKAEAVESSVGDVEATSTKSELLKLPALEPKTAIDPDVMYLLLAADIAMQRQQYSLAYEAYMELSKRVHDPKFAEQAAKLALQIKDSRKTNDAVSMWINQEPKNVTARKLAALTALRGHDKNIAIKQLNALLAAEPDNFENALLELSSILQKEGKEKFIYDALESLSTKTSSNKAVIYFVQSLLSMQMKNNAQAENKVKQTLQLQPDWEHPLLIQAQLAFMANDFNRVKSLLTAAVLKHPNNVPFKKLLAQTLIKTSDYESAAGLYESLINQNPKEGDNYIALALINLELNKDENAQTILKTLSEQSQWESAANFYLGKIEEKHNNAVAAVVLFDKVTDQQLSLEAAISSINLLVKERQFEQVDSRLSVLLQKYPQQKLRFVLMQASLYSQQNQQEKSFNLLSEMLEEFPDEKDVLYTRALVAEHLGKMEVLETDLKKIIAKYPDDVDALNALGYKLLDDSRRYREAEKYLQHAIKLRPSEPAIMDSYGWLLFKIGKYPQALNYLQSAYEKQNSGEIAAHLCEVLWSMGRKDEAQLVFDNALNVSPEDVDLMDFKQRFLK
ncbi:MAG: tetratricopeptide repeat protein [Methylococcaceae bacterium]